MWNKVERAKCSMEKGRGGEVRGGEGRGGDRYT